MSARRTTRPAIPTAARAINEMRAARAIDRPLATKLRETTATPIAADHPVPHPPAADPMVRARTTAGAVIGATFRTSSSSGSGLPVIASPVVQVDQVDGARGAPDHSDRCEDLPRPRQPIDQEPDQSPAQDSPEHVRGDLPSRGHAAPHVVGGTAARLLRASHRAAGVYRPPLAGVKAGRAFPQVSGHFQSHPRDLVKTFTS